MASGDNPTGFQSIGQTGSNRYVIREREREREREELSLDSSLSQSVCLSVCPSDWLSPSLVTKLGSCITMYLIIVIDTLDTLLMLETHGEVSWQIITSGIHDFLHINATFRYNYKHVLLNYHRIVWIALVLKKSNIQ